MQVTNLLSREETSHISFFIIFFKNPNYHQSGRIVLFHYWQDKSEHKQLMNLFEFRGQAGAAKHSVTTTSLLSPRVEPLAAMYPTRRGVWWPPTVSTSSIRELPHVIFVILIFFSFFFFNFTTLSSDVATCTANVVPNSFEMVVFVTATSGMRDEQTKKGNSHGPLGQCSYPTIRT